MTDEDKTLLEMAAKAAGYGLPSADDHDEIGRQYEYHLGLWVKHPWGWGWFRPHIDDGQSLRLAVNLKIDIHQRVAEPRVAAIAAMQSPKIESVADEKQRLAATRRAIVRADAEIGKAQQ